MVLLCELPVENELTLILYTPCLFVEYLPCLFTYRIILMTYVKT